MSPCQWSELSPIHREGAKELLDVVRFLSPHRRDPGPTGEGALSHVLRGEFVEHGARRPEVYEKFVARAISEPSLPQQVVHMQDLLPGFMSSH